MGGVIIKTSRILILAGILCLVALSGCSSASDSGSAQPTPTPAPAPEVQSIEVVPDPSVDAADMADPYAQADQYSMEIFHPDRELYNALFQAVLNREESMDLSSFNLSYQEKYNAASVLLSESGYHFFYLNNFKLSDDGSSIRFVYYDMDSDQIAYNRETFDARLSHLLYDVAPADGSDLQKFVAIYSFLCDNSHYTSDIGDPTTISPYSILVNGEGICGGYAELMQKALTQQGIEAEYVCCEAHAWDVVKLNGTWYHTDVTWGAGTGDDAWGTLAYMLMDDTERIGSLTDEGYGSETRMVGYPGGSGAALPTCTDDAFGAYDTAGYPFAFDVEGGKVYFCDRNGIDCMNLDCTGYQTLVQGDSCYAMFYFNGALYYDSADSGAVCRLVPGGQPEVIDSSEPFYFMKMDGTELTYAADAGGTDGKTAELLPLPEETGSAELLPGASVSRGESFATQVRFSQPMDKAQNWNECVYLVDDSGTAIPCSFVYDDASNTLTVRPRDYIDGNSALTVYVTGAAAQNGQALAACVSLRIDLVSQAES